VNQLLAKMGMHVVVIGNPVDGIRIVGPFKTAAHAEDYISSDPEGMYMWIAPLDAPADTFPLEDATARALRVEIERLQALLKSQYAEGYRDGLWDYRSLGMEKKQ
jgi:hypothetical protein